MVFSPHRPVLEPVCYDHALGCLTLFFHVRDGRRPRGFLVHLYFTEEKTWMQRTQVTCPESKCGKVRTKPETPSFLTDPLQYSCLENPHGQRSLAGYCPWGHKELDTTEATWQNACTHNLKPSLGSSGQVLALYPRCRFQLCYTRGSLPLCPSPMLRVTAFALNVCYVKSVSLKGLRALSGQEPSLFSSSYE